MDLSSPQFALALRDIIKSMVQKEIDDQRPVYRYGTVQTVDFTKMTATVIYPGETVPVTVRMGSQLPAFSGAIVRVDGNQTDRFISEIVGGRGTAAGFSGEIVMYGGGTVPNGWVLCNGAAVSRPIANGGTSDLYKNLYAVIGTTYGSGNGTTTFNLPDFTSAFPRGNTRTPGGGADTHVHGSAAHSHLLSQAGWAEIDVTTAGNTLIRRDNVAGATFTYNQSATGGVGSTSGTANSAAGLNGATDSATPGNVTVASNVPSYTGVLFLIKI